MKSDEELVLLYRSGVTEAVDVLMDRYKLLVRRMSRARFLIGGDEEDLIQEGMIGLYKAVRDFQTDKNASFRTFAKLCIDRQMIKAIASSNSRKHMPLNNFISLSDEEWDEKTEAAKDSPEDVIIRQELHKELLARMKKGLSPLERNVLDLYLNGLDYREIAERLERTPKSTDNALQRIRHKIAMEMNAKPRA